MNNFGGECVGEFYFSMCVQLEAPPDNKYVNVRRWFLSYLQQMPILDPHFVVNMSYEQFTVDEFN